MTEQPYDENDPDEGPEQDDLLPEPEDGGEVLRFAVEEDRARGPETRFQIGDDLTILVARRPKAALIMKLYRLTESASMVQQLESIDVFIDTTMDADSAAYLRDRFEDPDDEWDYDVLTPVIKALTAQWFDRPTGRSSASSRRPSRSGRRSTVRSQRREG